MTAELSPGDNNDDEFRALMERNWAVEPTLREMLDPGVRRLLDDAKSLEDSLNAANEPSEATIQEVLVNLSGDWDKLGIGAKTVKITGRLRPTAWDYENDIDGQTSEGSFIGLSAIRGDMLGKCCSAAGFGVIVRGFDIETVQLGEHGFLYRVVLQLGLDEDYNDEEIWFTACIDDIEYIEPLKPTPDGAEEFIAMNFPEVSKAILTLPDDCRDPEHILQVLDDFALTFDMSHADTTMGHDEILDLIETYLSDRLAFDNSSYDASISGVIYGRRMNYDKVPVDYSGTLRQLLICGVRLVPTPNTTEGETTVTYRPVLDTWYLVPENQGGRTQVLIPIDSLTKLIANRPEARDYPFGDDTIIKPNEEMEQGFVVEPLANAPDSARLRNEETVVDSTPDDKSKPTDLYYEKDLADVGSAIIAAFEQLCQKYGIDPNDPNNTPDDFEEIDNELALVVYGIKEELWQGDTVAASGALVLDLGQHVDDAIGVVGVADDETVVGQFIGPFVGQMPDDVHAITLGKSGQASIGVGLLLEHPKVIDASGETHTDAFDGERIIIALGLIGTRLRKFVYQDTPEL